MKYPLLLLAASCALGVPAAAQGPAYPKDVQAVLDHAAKSCREEGGTEMKFSAGDIQKIDLTGDGRDDYIVHLQNAECAEREAVFCGTGVCDLEILIANQDGTDLQMTWFQQPGVSDEQFRSEVEWTRSDLLRLKTFLENF